MNRPAEARSAVIDVGSWLTKAGFAGEEAPRAVFHSCVGEARDGSPRASLLGHAADVVSGEEAYADRGVLRLSWPVVSGHVKDAAQLETLLHHSFYSRLQVVPDVTPCLLLEPADQARADRERLAEVLFEGFNVPLLGLLNASCATVYATGRTTGLAVDSGAGKTMISAVCDGYCMAHCQRPSLHAGHALTDHLYAFLRSRGYPLSVQRDWELVNSLKETHCRTAPAASAVQTSAESEQPGGAAFALPDGECVFLCEAETRLAEELFDPSIAAAAPDAPATPTGYSSSNPSCRLARTTGGWADVICEVIAACPSPDARAELMQSVVLGGGTTMLNGVELRLQRELSGKAARAAAAVPPETAAKVVAFPQRARAAWTGGSIGGCSAAFADMCLTKAEYYESGAGSVHAHAV